MYIERNVKLKHIITPGKNQYGKPISIYIFEDLETMKEYIWDTKTSKYNFKENKKYRIRCDICFNVDGEPTKYIQKVKVIENLLNY